MLDPQARALLDLMEARGIPPTHTLTPEVARQFYRDRRAVTQPEPRPMAEVRNLAAPGPAGPIPLRLYRPAGVASPSPTLVYYHGGGWTIGDLDTHESVCTHLAAEAGCAVVSVDYRMGPEHRFPAAVDDAIAATRWLRAEGTSLGLDTTRMAVGGDSAGGNLAAVVALAQRDAGEALPPLRLQLLIYPATDMRAQAPSHTVNGEGYLLTRDTIAYFRAQYIDEPARYADWRASPLLHPDLSGLPPALVLTAGFDPLRDEGRLYADALSKAGTPAQYVCFERQIHGFLLMGRVLDEANTAVSLCAQVLRRALPTIPVAS
ncbi:alpha/beta hydrolase [Ideonella sp. A 288]|uniref:alpha/beta hydrolase n=1 Tax=Ideonella sp. A 288 TaxID=1962181 RepID=UPI000B4A7B22|nr:alpha/beta hydrolase [Ideonella sp. A 288]